MESRGAASPGILTLTTSLSKVRHNVYSNRGNKMILHFKAIQKTREISYSIERITKKSWGMFIT